LLEDLAGTGSVAAVIEVRDLRIEEKPLTHVPPAYGETRRPDREGSRATITNMALTKDDPLSTHAEPPSHPSFAPAWRLPRHRARAGRPRPHTSRATPRP